MSDSAAALIAIPDTNKALRHIIGGTFSGIILFIYFPLCVYGVGKFLQHKDWIVMRKRYQWITVFMLINLILSMAALAILMLCGYTLDDYPTIKEDGYALNFVLYPMLLFAVNIGWKTLWRNWAYYYDVMWIQAISSKEWKSLINEEEAANDWFLQNKGTYGKWQYFSIPYIALAIVDTMLLTMWEYILPPDMEQYKGRFVFGTAAVLTAIAASVVGYLRRKTPVFYDNFAIRTETSWILYCLLFGIFCVVAFVTSSFWVDKHDDEGSSTAMVIIEMAGYFLWATVYTVLVYITTIWVVRSNADWLNEARRFHTDSLEIAGIVALKDSRDDITDTFLRGRSGPPSTSIPFLEILAHGTSYATFVQHLSTEFNVESLLSLTEFVQFQQLIWQFMKEHDIDDDRDISSSRSSGRRSTSSQQIPLFKRLRFGDGIPRSSIVFGSGTEEECMGQSVTDFYTQCQEKARRLFTKYISYESKFQILIDFETSKAMCSLMENEERWMQLTMAEFSIIDMLYLFEESCDDMHMMLRDSYQRFQRTNSFERLNEFVYKFSN